MMRTTFLTALAAAGLILSGCGRESAAPQDTAMAPPPSSTVTDSADTTTNGAPAPAPQASTGAVSQPGSVTAYSPSGRSVVITPAQGTQPAMRPPVQTTNLADALAKVPRIPVETLKAKYDSGQAVIIDVRGLNYFHGHIKNALNIPDAQLPMHIAELPRNKQIVTYCT